MPWNCRPKFGVCSLALFASSGMATKIVVIGARNSCENAGAAISVAAAAAALTATCLIPMVPLLIKARPEERSRGYTLYRPGPCGSGPLRLSPGGCGLLFWGRFFLEQFSAWLHPIFELGIGNE